jgi:hypothetical protein
MEMHYRAATKAERVGLSSVMNDLLSKLAAL